MPLAVFTGGITLPQPPYMNAFGEKKIQKSSAWRLYREPVMFAFRKFYAENLEILKTP